MDEARDAFDSEDYVSAFLKYAWAAEQGIEIAQSNAAFLIDRGLWFSSKFILATNSTPNRAIPRAAPC